MTLENGLCFKRLSDGKVGRAKNWHVPRRKINVFTMRAEKLKSPWVFVTGNVGSMRRKVGVRVLLSLTQSFAG